MNAPDEYEVALRADGVAEIRLDGLVLEWSGARRIRDEYRGTLTVSKSGPDAAILLHDNVALTSAASRAEVIASLQLKGCEVPDSALVALEQAARQQGAPTPASSRSQATELLALADELTLYHTPAGEPYADAPINDHRETYALTSGQVRDYLTRRYWQQHRRAAHRDAIREALDVLIARARYDSPEIPVALRVAERAGAYYLDLGDSTWCAIEITPAGWSIVANPPVRFRRGRSMLPLPVPLRDGTLEPLRALVRVAEERDWWQLIGWLLAAFRPRGPYPVLALAGEPGAAKTTTARILRSLVDPAVAPVRAEPREGRDLIVTAHHGHVLAVDNISRLSPWLSDALCRLATGGGYAARQNYSDADEIVIDVQRPALITGIADVCTRSDLADRALLVTLPPLDDADRRPERELWSMVESVRPRVLGALLDAVAMGLHELPRTRLEQHPRMADYAEWITACEPALACKPGTMLAAYTASRAAASEATLEGSDVATALRRLVERTATWEGRTADLLTVLAEYVDDGVRRDPHRWPRAARGLREELTRLGPMLRRAGVIVTYPRRTGSGRKVRVTTVTPVTTVTTLGDSWGGSNRRGDVGDDGDGTAPTLDAEVIA